MSTEISFTRPHDAQDLLGHIYSAAARNLPLVEKDSHKGEGAIICSTGPSLMNKPLLRKIRGLQKDEGYIVFGLKESIPYLKKNGIEVTYSAAMDPGGGRQVARTPIDPDVTYCLASSCHPDLYDHVLGGGAEINIFHSACGQMEGAWEKGMMLQLSEDQHAVVGGEFELVTLCNLPFCPIVPLYKGEIEIYERLFGNGDTMCGGFTVTNRTVALARYMGFTDTVMLGTDFGWRKKGGSHYCGLVKVPSLDDTYMSDHGRVDGKIWYTRPDQLASALDIARKIKAGELTVLGDSLAAALAKRDDDFLDEIMRMK